MQRSFFYAQNSQILRLYLRYFSKRGDSVGGVQQGEVFIKFYVGAREGLIAALGGDLFTTYAVLASYMDRDGFCFPSQDLLAKNLGVTRETANRRLNKLKKFEWEGEKLIEKTIKVRDDKTKAWSKTVYKLNTSLAFRIFT